MLLQAPPVIYEDQIITFNCSVAGVGVVNVTWSRDGNLFPLQFDEDLSVVVPLSWNGSCLSCHVEANGTTANDSVILEVFSKFTASPEYNYKMLFVLPNPMDHYCV